MSLDGAPVPPSDFGPEYNSYVTDPLFGRRFTAVYVVGTLVFVALYLPHLYRSWRTGRIWQGWAIYENTPGYIGLDSEPEEKGLSEGNKSLPSEREAQPSTSLSYPPTSQSRVTPQRRMALLKAMADRFQLRVHPKLTLDIGQLCVLVAYLTTLLVCVIYQAPLTVNPNRAGFLTLAQLPFVFLFAAKASPATFLLGRGYEKLNFIHKWAGRGLLLSASIHGSMWIRDRIKNNQISLLAHEEKELRGYTTFSLLCLIVLSSLRPIRRFAYDFFYALHVALVIAFLVAVNYHTPYAIPWIVPPVAFYSFDLLVRVIRMRFKDAFLEAPDEQMTLIRIPDVSGGWIAGQHVRLRVFIGSRIFSSHPLSVCNAPPSITNFTPNNGHHDGGMILAARNCGDWSAALNALARSELSEDWTYQNQSQFADPRSEEGSASNDEKKERRVGVMIDGPYGGSSVDFGQCENVLMIGGGSGVTFILGLLDDLFGRIVKERGHNGAADAGGCLVRTRRVRFVWCIKSYACILWFAEQLSTISRLASDPSLQIHLSFQLFVTCPCTPSGSDMPSIMNCEVTQIKVNIPDVMHQFIEDLPLDSFGGGLGVTVSGPESLTTASRNAVAGIHVAQACKLGGVELHTEAYTL
ncbi:hypothetical protein FRB94_006197 [Tulasnella sp. JGI-2019a]|nr:hypothetical protein FRB94_006197 [Tulasnella sp. JGI-2019a]